MKPKDSGLGSFLDIAVLTAEKRCTMHRANSQKGFIDKVHIARHQRDLVTPEADVIIPEEPDNGRRYEVVIQRQLLLSPTCVPP
jgi:hypothetical protein